MDSSVTSGTQRSAGDAPATDPSVTRNNSAAEPSPEPSPEPLPEPRYYAYDTAGAAERAALRYADPARWPNGSVPSGSRPVAFIGGGLVWAYGEFAPEELEEMQEDPEAFLEHLQELEEDDNVDAAAMRAMREMSEDMEEGDAQGGNPAGRAELAAEEEDAEHETSATQAEKSRRGQSWKSWEDRCLVLEILNVDPYTCVRGSTEAKWAEISNNLRCFKCERSGNSCKQRAAKLVKEHQAGNARSLQKTGTDEQVNEFIVNLDSLVELATTVSRDAEKKNEARARQEKLDDDGKRVRAAAFQELELDEERRRTKRPKADATQILDSMDQHLAKFDEEKRKLDQVEERHHAETTQLLAGLIQEMKAGREEARRREELRDEKQRERDRAMFRELRSLASPSVRTRARAAVEEEEDLDALWNAELEDLGFDV